MADNEHRQLLELHRNLYEYLPHAREGDTIALNEFLAKLKQLHDFVRQTNDPIAYARGLALLSSWDVDVAEITGKRSNLASTIRDTNYNNSVAKNTLSTPRRKSNADAIEAADLCSTTATSDDTIEYESRWAKQFDKVETMSDLDLNNISLCITSELQLLSQLSDTERRTLIPAYIDNTAQALGNYDVQLYRSSPLQVLPKNIKRAAASFRLIIRYAADLVPISVPSVRLIPDRLISEVPIDCPPTNLSPADIFHSVPDSKHAEMFA